MNLRFHNYFKAERKKTALTGKDIAFLLEKNYENWSSRYESGVTIPSLMIVIGYLLICNTTIGRLLRQQIATITTLLITRIPLLIKHIQQNPTAIRKDARIDYLYFLLSKLTEDVV